MGFSLLLIKIETAFGEDSFDQFYKYSERGYVDQATKN